MNYKNLILFCIFTFVGFVYPQRQDTLQTDPVNIRPNTVLNRYIYSIGGMDKFKSVLDRTTVMTGTAMGQPINIVIMQKYPDKLFQELQAGEVKQFLYYNSGKGTMIIGDEKINIEGKELERLSMDATMQLLLDPESHGVKMELLPIEYVDSVECLVIKFTLPSGIRWFQYYENDSGLKVKEIKEIQTGGGLLNQETYFSDFREVSGLIFPFTLKQFLVPTWQTLDITQEIDLAVTSIEINTGLDDKVFEVPE